MRRVLAFVLIVVAVAPAGAATLLPIRELVSPVLRDDFGFGRAMVAVGPNLLVGGPGRPGPGDVGSDQGRAFLIDGSGVVLRTFSVPDTDEFGASVAAAGTACLIGAPGAPQGAAHLFDCGTGALLRSFTLPTATQSFGAAVALVGGDVLVGDPNDGTPVPGYGAVHRFDAATGALVATIYPPESPLSLGFGTALAVGTDRFVVSAPLVGAPAAKGVVHLYDAATSAWLYHVKNPTPPPGVIGDVDLFGWSVAFLGTNLLVGDPWDNSGGVVDGGAVYVFGGFAGQLLHTIRGTQPRALAGTAVVAHGDGILFSLPGEPVADFQLGAAHLTAADGTPIAATTGVGGDERRLLGTSVAALGNTVVIGDPGFTEGVGDRAGRIVFFSPCGDGVLDPGEGCDDGNLDDCDGCDARCRPEVGWACGDGTLNPACGEACDDGAANSDVAPDACRTDCTPHRCGDGVVDGGETCDDGGVAACDGCGATCQLEPGIVCGDGILEPACGEQCDDGNAVTGDGCDGIVCRLEFIAGNGHPATDCAAGWSIDNPTNVPRLDARGQFNATQRCTDDDPRCDFDGGVPGTCTFHLRGCALSTSHPVCSAPTRLSAWALVRPSAKQASRDPVAGAVRAAILGAVPPAIVGPSETDVCSELVAIPVPMRGGPGAWRATKSVILTRATDYANGIDKDKLILICVPAAP